MWMISYRYKAVFKEPDGRERSHGDGVDTIEVIDEHPMTFLANTRQKRHAPATQQADRCDDITRVYWAMEVPDGLLDEDEIDSFQ